MKLILITFVSLILGMMVACDGWGVRYAGAQDVVDSFNEFDLQNCEGMFAQMVGANSGLKCEVEQRTVEVYTYDGNAETLCDNDDICKELRYLGATQIYLDNLMLVVYDDVDFGNALIADLQK